MLDDIELYVIKAFSTDTNNTLKYNVGPIHVKYNK